MFFPEETVISSHLYVFVLTVAFVIVVIWELFDGTLTMTHTRVFSTGDSDL